MARPTAPAVDPLAVAAAESAREQARQAHEKEMKRMELESAARIAAERQAREDAKEARSEQLERDKIASSEKLAQMKIDADERKADEARRRDEQKAIQDQIAASNKNTQDAIAASNKMLTDALAKLNDKKEEKSVPAQMMEWKEMFEMFSGGTEKPAETSEVAKELAKQAPEVLKLFGKLADKIGSTAGPSQPALQPGTVAAVVIQEPAPQQAAPAPAPQQATVEVIPPFEFPDDATPTQNAVVMLGRSIELALQARWDSPRIYRDVVTRFPTSLKGLIRNMESAAVIEAVESTAPADAILRSARGKSCLRILHLSLRKDVK